jgi:putative transposase
VLGLLIALFRSRRDLVLENAALRHQLGVALRTKPRPRLRQRDRVFWVWLARLWPGGWRRHLAIVQPEQEMRELIADMSRLNRLWGSERIRGELLKLGITVSNRSIRRYRWRPARPPGSQSWRTFLTNELKGIWAADFLVVQTVGFRTPYVFFFVTHERREVVHFNVTSSPTAAWAWQQFLNATPWGRQPRYLIHDRDATYGGELGPKLRGLGVTDIRTPIRAPNANAVAERVIGTVRRECLDHVIILNERHLRAVLNEFVDYYNSHRPHRSLGLQAPLPAAAAMKGRVVARPILGGLHHVYARAV